MDSLEKLKRAIIAQVEARVPVQTVWATCKSVDVTQGLMVASREGLDYDDVLLGLGADITVPVAGSKVLLGLVENKQVATFLLFAESIEERRINGNVFGGLVKADEVANEINALKAQVNQLKAILTAWVPVAGDGGAALKAATTAWSSSQLQPVLSGTLQNSIVSHG